MHAPVKRRSQHADCSMGLSLNENSVPPLARPPNPAAPRPALSNCRITLAGLRRVFEKPFRGVLIIMPIAHLSVRERFRLVEVSMSSFISGSDPSAD
jgi:hypothetical protein